MKAPVVLLIKDDSLRPALYRQLLRWPEFELHIDDPEPGSIVVSTPRDCPLETSRELTDRGCTVVIIAPVEREQSRKQYLRAGAFEYIAMDIDSAHLAAVIRQASQSHARVHIPAPNVAVG